MNVEIKEKYIHLYSDLVLTNWDKKDILTYSGSKHVYLHDVSEVSSYYEISEAEHFKNEAERENAEMAPIENITE